MKKGHRIHALVTSELAFTVTDEAWLPSRIAQEVQELVTGKPTGTHSVNLEYREIIHLTIDNNPLEAAE